MSAEQPSFSHILDKLPPHVKPLVYWENPIKSAIVMVAGLTILLSVGCLSMVSVFAYFCLAILCCTAAWRVYYDLVGSKKTDPSSVPPKPFNDFLSGDVVVPRERVDHYVKLALDHSSDLANYFRHALLVENYLDSLKFGLYMYMLSILGGFFNLITLVTIAFVLLFILPKPYKVYQSQIDGAINAARKRCDDFSSKVKTLLEKVPGLRKAKTN
nr:unnamed protein product [Spirometra erinaceieuropaei]